MKAFKLGLAYDMQGLSGQDDIDGVSPSDPAYPATRKLLTDDVNATIAGLFDGGAKSVTVFDRHGGGDGSLEIDVLADQLDKRAKLIDYKLFDLSKRGVFDSTVRYLLACRYAGRSISRRRGDVHVTGFRDGL